MNQVYENTQGPCAEGLQQTIWRNFPYKIISPHLSSELESNISARDLPGKAIPLLSLWSFNYAYFLDFSDPCEPSSLGHSSML